MKYSILVLLIVCFSCNSSRNISSSKSSKDSSYVKTLETKVSELSYANELLNKQVREFENAGIIFDKKCDTTINEVINQILKSGCPQEKIDSFVIAIRSLQSRVKILSDGSIEASGFISTITRQKERMENTVYQLVLEKELLKDSIEIINERVSTTAEQNTKEVKNSLDIGFLRSWYLYLVALLIGFGGGFYLSSKKMKK